MRIKNVTMLCLAMMLVACGQQNQKETNMEFTDNVKMALADSGRISLDSLQWTREPAGFEVRGDTIRITTERGKGYGKQIMLHAIDAAVEHFDAKCIDIEAQEYAKGFYESVGFTQSSDPFMLDGIPHIRMTWTITTNTNGGKDML